MLLIKGCSTGYPSIKCVDGKKKKHCDVNYICTFKANTHKVIYLMQPAACDKSPSVCLKLSTRKTFCLHNKSYHK